MLRMANLSDREIQVMEMSQQLTMAFEQVQACNRQMQLCKNQMSKTNITMNEVQKSNAKMYRACGRMFVLADPAQLKKDLQSDIDRIQSEHNRCDEMAKNFEAKKQILTAQLNDLTPKEKK